MQVYNYDLRDRKNKNMETEEAIRRFNDAGMSGVGKLTVDGREYQAYLDNGLLLGIGDNCVGRAYGKDDISLNEGLEDIRIRTGVRFH